MSIPPLGPPAHPPEVRDAHDRLLTEAGLTGSTVRTCDGGAVHVVERGAGTPVVLIHGSGSPGLFWLPLLQRLDGVRSVVVDRPGFGLSDPVAPATTPTETAAGWIERLLDALDLPSAILLGHSMGGLWVLRFALAHPGRVTGLAMIGTPALPGTRAPLPFRLLGTPGVGALVARQRETTRSVRRFATMMGEGDTIGDHPLLVELMVAAGNDPVAGQALQQEVRTLLLPWALASRTGFRRRARVAEADLRGLEVPTLLIWGDRDPVGDGDVARRLQRLIPEADLRVLEGGHAPWLGSPDRVAEALLGWVRSLSG